MHYVGTFIDSGLAANPTYGANSHGYTEAALVDHTSGSVHTGLSIAQLAAGGTLAPHVHSYEEGFYILSGEVVARHQRSDLPARSRRLRVHQGGHAPRLAERRRIGGPLAAACRAAAETARHGA